MIAVSALWVLFIALHVGLATLPLRSSLVARLGELGFVVVYSSVASLVFAALVWAFADAQFGGPPGLALAAVPGARPVLIAAVVVGMALMVGAFAPRGYWESPGMVLAPGERGPVGLERVTRHPFFAGAVLTFGAHALLATHLVGTVFFGGFLVLIAAGTAHQGVKLRALRGASYGRYLAETSAVPFLAILAGRQRFVATEVPWVFLALGVLSAAGIRSVHGFLFTWHGAPVSGTVIGASWLIGFVGWYRGRRSNLRPLP